MRTFVNKRHPAITIDAIDGNVVEGNDAFFLKDINYSLPKEEWEEKK